MEYNFGVNKCVPLLLLLEEICLSLEQQSITTVGKLYVTSPKLTYKIACPILTYNFISY